MKYFDTIHTWIDTFDNTITVMLSIMAIVISIITAVRQSRLSRRMSLYKDRDTIIHEISKDKQVNRLDVELLFPRCLKHFDLLVKAKQMLDNSNADISEFFDYVSDGMQITKESAEQKFQSIELASDEAGDDFFEIFCKKNEYSYESIPGEGMVTRNYLDLQHRQSDAQKEYEECKQKLIAKMKNSSKL